MVSLYKEINVLQEVTTYIIMSCKSSLVVKLSLSIHLQLFKQKLLIVLLSYAYLYKVYIGFAWNSCIHVKLLNKIID